MSFSSTARSTCSRSGFEVIQVIGWIRSDIMGMRYGLAAGYNKQGMTEAEALAGLLSEHGAQWMIAHPSELPALWS